MRLIKKIQLTFLFLVMVAAMSFEYLAQRQLEQYSNSERPNRWEIEALNGYLKIRGVLKFLNGDQLVIANSFHLARMTNGGIEYSMNNAGRAIKNLNKLVQTRDSENEWSLQAAYELLVILNAIPWDKDIAELARHASVKIFSELKRASSKATGDEMLLISNALLIYQTRAESQDFRVSQTVNPNGNSHHEFQLKMQNIRQKLAQCMTAGWVDDIKDSDYEMLNLRIQEISQKKEIYEGLDSLRVKSALLATTKKGCIQFAEKFDLLVN